MNLKKLHNIINLLQVAGINQANIVKQDNHVSVYAADEVEEEDDSPSIVVISDVASDVTDTTMGISRVSVLLKRMNLFDIDKIKESHTKDEHFLRNVVLKEGRKRASYTFSNPETINVPNGAVEENVIKKIVLTKDYVSQLSKAISAMNAKIITLESINKEIILRLDDDISDSFSEVIDTDEANGEWLFNWKTNSVLRLLRHAIKLEDEVTIEVGDVGIMYMNISGLRFMIMPQVI